MKRGGISWLAALLAALIALWVYARLAARPVPLELSAPLGAHARCLLDVDETRLAIAGGAAQREAVERWLATAELTGWIESTDGDRLLVRVSDPDHALLGDAHAFSPDPLRFHVVLDGTPWAQKLAQRAEGDPAAAGITVEPDSWTNEDDSHTDFSLTAADRPALERYIAAATDLDALRPAGSLVLFEHDRGRGRWRTYLVGPPVDLDAGDIASADMYWDPATDLPEVFVTFTAAGREQLAQVSATNVGRKMAIVVQGTVTSAPVIRSPITGGITNITMGEQDRDAALREAHALTTALRAAAAAAGVRVVGKQAVARDCDPLPWRLLVAGGCGLLALALGFAGARLLPIAVAPRPLPAAGGGAFPWARVAVTVGALAVVFLRPMVLVPGLERAREGPIYTIFMLGLTPLFSGFVLVELAALAVPRWSRLRDGGGRATLDANALGLGFLLAFVQAYFAVLWLRANGEPTMHDGRLALLVGVCSLAGGTALLAVVAGVISRFGVGNGYLLVLLVTSAPPRVLDGDRALLQATLGLGAVAVVWALHRAVAGRRLPSSGVVPLVWGTAFEVVATILTSASVMPRWLENYWPASWPLEVQLTVFGATALLCSWLFGIRRRTGLGWADAASAIYVVALAALEWAFSDPFVIRMLMLATLTAAILDVVADARARRRARDLVELRPLHRVDEADAVAAALAEAGLPCHLRNLAARTLFHFFAPFVPIVVMVPAARADEAAAVVDASLQR